MTCNHILGVSVGKITDNKTGEVLASWKSEVTADQVEWHEDGSVNAFWSGSKYKFCPLCGKPLGSLAAEYRTKEKR